MKNKVNVIFFALSALMVSQAHADPAMKDSTSSRADVIAGDTSMFGGGTGKRIISGNLRDMYNGAVAADGSRIVWPYLCYTSNPYCPSLYKCNISSGSCSTAGGQTRRSHTLSASGLVTYTSTKVWAGEPAVSIKVSPWVK